MLPPTVQQRLVPDDFALCARLGRHDVERVIARHAQRRRRRARGVDGRRGDCDVACAQALD